MPSRARCSRRAGAATRLGGQEPEALERQRRASRGAAGPRCPRRCIGLEPLGRAGTGGCPRRRARARRSGCQAAKPIELWPPIEWPTSDHPLPAERIHDAEQVGGEVLACRSARRAPSRSAPCPRWSSEMTWNRSAKAGTTPSNQCEWAEPPCRKQRAGRPGSPHSSARSVMPLTRERAPRGRVTRIGVVGRSWAAL